MLQPAELISFTLKNIPLRTTPGSTFDYSDFGYLVLGRIIEKVSGMPYSDFVKKRILTPLRISDMQIEDSSAEGSRKNEAIYYSDVNIPILRSEKMDEEAYAFTALGDACYDLTNWYNLGDYRGSASEIVRAANGYCWAILVNTYRPALDDFLHDMDQITWSAIGNPATHWPDKDLF
jgi:CubicO group peptidase (beta-lactamase class C family)